MSDAALQTCYRHPDRRAGVICQRCDRPICPDCMHQASVGFHCPECARAGRQKVVRGPAAFGVSPSIVANVLIAINAAIFVYGIGDGLMTRDAVIIDGGLFERAFIGGEWRGVAEGEWWRIVTSGFLHANAIHIAFNCFALYQLGLLMEPVLGRLRFALVYFVAMLSGSLGVLLVEPNGFTVGASGAVFGLMGAAVAAMRSRGINPFHTQLGGVIVLNLLITFSVSNISIGGHVGGLIGGFVAGWILLDLGPGATRNPAIPTIAVAVLGLAIAGTSLAIV